MHRRHRLHFLLALLPAFLILANPSDSSAQGPRIAIVADGPSDLFNHEAAILAQEVDALLADSHEGFACPTTPTHVGDYTYERAQALVAEVLANREIDIVVGMGIYTGRAVGAVENLSKPVFLPYAAPRLQGLPQEEGTSGRRNLAYLTGPFNLQRDLDRFRQVVRRDNAVFLIDRYLAEAIPNLPDVINSETHGDTRVVMVDPPVASILDAIPEGTEGIYLGPLFRLPESEEQALIDGLNARRLPTYASGGRSWVDRGAFVSLVPADEDQRRLRRVALDIGEALQGEQPARFSTLFEERSDLAINMATASEIGVWPTFELMTEATLVGQDESRARGREIDLQTAVQEAVQTNLAMAAVRIDAEVADQRMRQARGAWLPTVDANAGFTWMDPDAANSFGNAERQLNWGLNARQVVYSPRIHQGLRAARANQEATRYGVRSRELDVVRDASTSYLNVLRARTAERVNRDNLQRIRRNLALAEVRVQVGSANRSDVHRWQIEIADSRASVISAAAQRNQAEIALNRMLNRDDLEESFQPAEPLNPSEAIVMDPEILPFIEDPWSFRLFRAFVAQEAIRNSPEIRQLDASIEALDEQLTGLRRALYIPDVAVSGGVNHVFRRAGEGSEDAPAGSGFPPRDNFTWQVGASLNFRVFDATRYAEISQNEAQLAQLQIQRRDIAQQVEQGVRSAMHQASSSRAAVRLRRDAAQAANDNLDMVRDAYRRGATNIITLIDAQSQALLTQLSAANAVYDFLIDFVQVERTTGEFGFRRSSEEREDFLRRLRAFVAERRQEP